MLKTLVIATLCVATLAAPRSPPRNGAMGRDRQRPGQVRPGSVPGVEQPLLGMPRSLPSMMSTQLEDLFQRMQLQQDANQLDLTLWQDRTQTAVEGWWTAISARMSMVGRDFTVPADVSNGMRDKITEVFTQMQNEVSTGYVLNLDHWQEVLREDAQDSWSNFVDATTPGQPDYTVDRPRGEKPVKGEKPVRGEKLGKGRGEKPGRGQEPGRGGKPSRGNGQQNGRPDGRGSPPVDLPQPMRQQLTDLFEGMQQELDTGRDLALPDWNTQTQDTVQNWWTRVKGRLEAQNVKPPGGRRTFPDEVHPRMQQNIQDVFEGMQEEVNAGRELDLTQWGNQMGDHAEGWWDKVTGLMNGNEPNPRGNGPRGHGPGGHGVRDNLPPKMGETLREVFEGLQQEIEKGNQVDLDVWRNKTLDVIEAWWERMSNIAERKNPKAADKKPFFENAPSRWQEQVNDLFDRMQLQLDSGELLNVKGWYAEINKSAERWWDAFARRAEPGRPFVPRKNFAAEMPDRMAEPVHDVFDRMQTEVDNQLPLELMQYHDEIQEIAASWWNRFSVMKGADMGKPGKPPRKDMPIEMRTQITEVFTRMREETGAQDWDIDYWRNETLAMAQEWWQKFTNADLKSISQKWIAALQDIFEEYVNNTDTVDIDQWREQVLNQSQSWCDFDVETLKKFGFKSREDIKKLDRPSCRIPQHINHIFDRLKLKSMDGVPLDMAEWQEELENLASGWGKRILAHKDRPDERPGRPQGRPDRPNGRPGRPQGRPERPNERPGRPQGRPERPNERPGRPQGRPDRPQGRPGRPNGRPDRPQERPGRPNGRPDRPQERPGKPYGRPDRPQERPERPQGGPGMNQEPPRKPYGYYQEKQRKIRY